MIISPSADRYRQHESVQPEDGPKIAYCEYIVRMAQQVSGPGQGFAYSSGKRGGIADPAGKQVFQDSFKNGGRGLKEFGYAAEQRKIICLSAEGKMGNPEP